MKLSKLIFFFLLLLLPTQLGKHFWPEFSYVLGQRVDYLSPTIYLTDILIGFLFLLDFKAILEFFKKNFTVLLFCCFTAILLSLFWVRWQKQSPGLLIYRWLKLGEYFFLVFWVKRNATLKQSLLPLNLSVLWSSFLAWGQFWRQGSLGLWFLGERNFHAGTPGIALTNWQGQLFLRPYATFPHPNVLAGYILVVLILNLFLAWQPLILKRLTLVLGTSVLLIAFSRAASLVWLAAVVIYLMKKKHV